MKLLLGASRSLQCAECGNVIPLVNTPASGAYHYTGAFLEHPKNHCSSAGKRFQAPTVDEVTEVDATGKAITDTTSEEL